MSGCTPCLIRGAAGATGWWVVVRGGGVQTAPFLTAWLRSFGQRTIRGHRVKWEPVCLLKASAQDLALHRGPGWQGSRGAEGWGPGKMQSVLLATLASPRSATGAPAEADLGHTSVLPDEGDRSLQL